MRPDEERRQTATSAEQIAARRGALEHELAGYEAAGNDERAAAVRHELDRLADPADVAAAEEAPVIAEAESRPARATARGKRAQKRG